MRLIDQLREVLRLIAKADKERRLRNLEADGSFEVAEKLEEAAEIRLETMMATALNNWLEEALERVRRPPPTVGADGLVFVDQHGERRWISAEDLELESVPTKGQP